MTATSPTETKVTGQPRAIKRATGRSRDRVAFEAPPASHQPKVAFQAPLASHQPKAAFQAPPASHQPKLAFEAPLASHQPQVAFQAPPASQEPGPRGSLAGVAPFVTKSGLKVHVYKADITKLPVDAIVWRYRREPVSRNRRGLRHRQSRRPLLEARMCRLPPEKRSTECDTGGGHHGRIAAL